MRKTVFFIACALLFLCAGPVRADEPILEQGIKIMDGGSALVEDWFSIPFVVDWNNDGAKDLLVGQFVDGYILLFLNQGTDLNPVFNGHTRIQSNGVPITTTHG